MDTGRLHRRRVLLVSGSLALATVLGILIWQLRLVYLGDLLVKQILADVPCEAPCWQGIIPGETPKADALRILGESPYVRRDTLQENGTGEIGGAVWGWMASTGPLKPTVYWEDSIVQQITLVPTCDLTVAEVVGKFDLPEAFIVSEGGVPEYPYWIVGLYYPRLGAKFKVYTDDLESGLEPLAEVRYIVFYAPTSLEARVQDELEYGYEEEVSRQRLSRELSRFRLWTGYGDLPDLYDDSPPAVE